jgi:hypothetical protein
MARARVAGRRAAGSSRDLTLKARAQGLAYVLRELERLHAGLLKLAALPDEDLRALVGSLLEGEELASSE